MPVVRADSDRSAAPAVRQVVGQPLAHLDEVAITHDEARVATPASVTFDVSPGEVVLLLGPSGSGKSTLALALNGLIPHALPASVDGTVRIEGVDTSATTVAALSTRVGMVFQDPDAQLVTGTLLDEVAFGPENLKLPVAEVLARAEAALRRVGLWDRRRENPDRLSGGGRQRLAIACALAMGSPLLVLDEPTANLDPRGIDEVYAALGDLVAAGDRAIVLVEHNLDAAIGFVDRVVVLDAAGRLLADGHVDDVLRRRADELHRLGVWLPHSALAALRLRRAGYALAPLPLTPAELRDALEATPPVAAPREASAPAATRATGDPVVRVRGLEVRRGRTDVLHGVDLEVRRGEFVAIVGANGAGKTTLVQAIAGVIRPPRRSVSVDGADIAAEDWSTCQADIGLDQGLLKLIYIEIEITRAAIAGGDVTRGEGRYVGTRCIRCDRHLHVCEHIVQENLINDNDRRIISGRWIFLRENRCAAHGQRRNARQNGRAQHALFGSNAHDRSPSDWNSTSMCGGCAQILLCACEFDRSGNRRLKDRDHRFDTLQGGFRH